MVLVSGLTMPADLRLHESYLSLRKQIENQILGLSGPLGGKPPRNPKFMPRLIIEGVRPGYESMPYFEVAFATEEEAVRTVRDYNLRDFQSRDGVHFTLSVRIKIQRIAREL
jgi:hypothetical protein